MGYSGWPLKIGRWLLHRALGTLWMLVRMHTSGPPMLCSMQCCGCVLRERLLGLAAPAAPPGFTPLCIR